MTTATYPARARDNEVDAPYWADDPSNPARPAGVGPDLGLVAQACTTAISHYYFPSSRQREGIEARFHKCRNDWREATKFESSPVRIAMHPAYQSIVGLGPKALPMIMRDLEREPALWFWALRAITGLDPVKASERGRLDSMTQAWLAWGRSSGIKW